MVWEAEPIKNFLGVTHIQTDGKEFLDSQEFTPRKYSTNISLYLLECDVELRILPYNIEHLKKSVEEDYENGIINELFVGIRDRRKIEYVGKLWTPKRFGDRRINQYFFKNDKPSGFNFGNISGPGWPLNQPQVLDERLIQYFIKLKDIRPSITDSLDKCIEHLTRPGPEYTRLSDGSLHFKIVARK
jgi:hypothetical protein